MDGKLIGLVRDTVIDRYGERLWESLAHPCGPEAEEAPSDALACWVGRDAVPALRQSYPSLFDRHADLESFIRGLGDDLPSTAVHDASDLTPISFTLGDTPDGSILLRVQADCSLCALIQGVIAGAAVHYEQQVMIDELKSPRRGDNACVLQIELNRESDLPDSGLHEYRVAAI